MEILIYQPLNTLYTINHNLIIVIQSFILEFLYLNTTNPKFLQRATHLAARPLVVSRMRNDLDEQWVIIGTDEAAGKRRGAVEADSHTLGTAEDLGISKTEWIKYRLIYEKKIELQFRLHWYVKLRTTEVIIL